MLIVAVLLSVNLTAPFGTAAAEATDVGLPLEVGVTVEVAGPQEAVLARIVTAAGELEPVAMVSRHDGTWGATIRLTEREDVLVAFEALGSGDESAISEAHRLTELGVDPAIFAIGDPTEPPDDDSLPEGAVWLAVAVAAAVVAIVLLAVWARHEAVDAEPSDHVLSVDPDHSGNPDNDDSGHG